MTVLVSLPRAWRDGGVPAALPAEGATVREVLDHLERGCPGLRRRVLDEAGSVRRHVGLFLNDEDVRFRRSLETPVQDGDRLAVVPAMAGG